MPMQCLSPRRSHFAAAILSAFAASLAPATPFASAQADGEAPDETTQVLVQIVVLERASTSPGGWRLLSAPHILTLANTLAEIRLNEQAESAQQQLAVRLLADVRPGEVVYLELESEIEVRRIAELATTSGAPEAEQRDQQLKATLVVANHATVLLGSPEVALGPGESESGSALPLDSRLLAAEATVHDGALVVVLRPHVIASPEDLRQVYDDYVDLSSQLRQLLEPGAESEDTSAPSR